MMRKLGCFVVLLAAACAGADAPELAPETAGSAPALSVPAWSKDAIWYQIFVERFRNGDPSNDPTLHDIEGSWPHAQPAAWQPTAWTHDWYSQEPWARATGRDFWFTAQLRRYGGDLQGVLDELDYLQALGVTALYLNPINDAPSLHKYDARTYRHVDRNFGPDPRGDEARMAAEDPLDPSTWTFTAADSLFLVLVDEVHRRGMRVILDYSWNHTGVTFWAWRDVLANQAASPFADWYEIQRFDDAATPDTSEFAYRGWAGVRELPELKKTGRPEGQTHGAIEGTLVAPVREHVFNVTRRWLDPNGDGDPADGIDGFRLDVAEMVPLGFWREYRTFVRGINPDAYLVGEVWWEQWPERMYDPAPWLQGDVFDAVMNYRWYEPTRRFFAGAPPALTASQYVTALDSITAGIGREHQQAMMNLTASHDAPRFATSIFNPGRYKHRVTPREDPDYRVGRPGARTREIQRMILVQQFTWLGAPHIWYGDEVGMWGADDPDTRKPMLWSDVTYDAEVADPRGLARTPDAVAPDTALLRFYRDLSALRNAHLRLFVDGSVEWLLVDDERRLLAYARELGDARVVAIFNASDEAQTVTVHIGDGSWRVGFGSGEVAVRGGVWTGRIAGRTAIVLVRE
jgi:cyclomaltodextrinase / maltogenic alpha-amylase / neopullulanase